MSDNKLKVHTFPTLKDFSLAKTKDFKQQNIKLDVQGKPLKSPINYFIAFSEHEFILAGGSDKAAHTKHLNKDVKGKFLPDLWKEDCLELFLSLDDSGQYFEFNLSPTGAWWAEKFFSYRKADSSEDMSKLSCTLDYELSENSFYTYLKVDFKDFLKGKSLISLIKEGTLKGNFSAVLMFDGKEHLVSAAHSLDSELQKDKADFHLEKVRVLVQS